MVNNEDEMVELLLTYSQNKIRDEFECINDLETKIYIFIEKKNIRHYITVHKTRKEFNALVNANFDFYMTIGSNKCKQLLDVGKKFVEAFDLHDIEWIS